MVLLFTLCLLQAQTFRLSGKIFTQDGRAAAMATVRISELSLQTITNEYGRYSFNNIAAGSYTLTVSSVGFQTYQKTIEINSSTTWPDIYLEQNAVELEQVTITAEKKATNLQKTAMAVSAISGKQIEERKIQEMGDLVLAVPNLMSMNLGSPTLSSIAIRGILTFSETPAVGVYVDGVPMFDGYASSTQMKDIERIEVLRGPQSTLYGRNALGGIINILTRQPGNKLKGLAEAGYGNYGNQHYAAGISGPLVKNKLLAGFSGMYTKRNGYYTNLYTNKKFDKPETMNGNFYLTWLASDKLSVTFNSKAEINNIIGTFPYVINADSALKYPYTINQNGTNEEKRTLLTNSITINYQLKGAKLTSMTGFTYLDDTYKNYDVDYSPYDLMIWEMPKQRTKTWIQELRLVTDQQKKWQLTAGIFAFADQKQAENVYIYRPDAVMMDPNAPYNSGSYTTKKINSISGYATLRYRITDKWNVSAGLRYEYEDRSLRYHSDFVKAPDPAIVTPEQKITGHNSALSPKLSVAYLPNENVQFYGTYTRGYRPGGFNQFAVQQARLNYDPEYTDNFELGFKSEWLNRRLRINAAIFHTYWKDQQQALALPEIIVQNIGELTNTGAEVEVTSLLTKDLELRYNFGWIYSDYKVLYLPDAANPGENINGKGNKQIFTPSFTSALSLAYHKNLNNNWSLFVIPEWKLLGKQYMTYYNDLEQNSFNLVNANIGIKYQKLELSLWGKNLTDSRYISFIYATQTRATSPALIGAPRTYGILLRTRF